MYKTNSLKILTISVAAYNVENYIDNALNSIVVEEILEDIEVIVIDDGSTDQTYSIAKKYENMYPNTFKVIHKKNGGYGSTVNYSIKYANGKYFKILDGDDWYDKEGLLKLVNKLKSIDLDMVITSFNKVIDNREVKSLDFSNFPTCKTINIRNIDINEGIPMHAITYKTKVIRDSNLVLKEHMLYTDNYYVALPLINVNTIFFYDINVYNYRVGHSGQSVNRDVNIKHINNSRNISLDLVNYFNCLYDKEFPAYKYMCVRIASTCVDYLAATLTLPTNMKSLNMMLEFDNIIRSTSKEIYLKMISIDRKASKIVSLLRKTNYLLYWPLSILRKIF